MDFECYACHAPAWRQCPQCRAVFCPGHGDRTCLRCGGERRWSSVPRPALVSSTLFRGSLLALAAVVVIQLGPTIVGIGRPGAAPPAVARSATTATPTATLVATPRPSPTTTPSPTATPSPSPTATPTPTATATPRPKAIPYVVQPGDSLRAIAERFGVSAETLAAYNGVSDPDRIGVGQTILIPQ